MRWDRCFECGKQRPCVRIYVRTSEAPEKRYGRGTRSFVGVAWICEVCLARLQGPSRE
jgi:hypothetical protein